MDEPCDRYLRANRAIFAQRLPLYAAACSSWVPVDNLVGFIDGNAQSTQR